MLNPAFQTKGTAGSVSTKKRERGWSCEQDHRSTGDIADVSADVSVLRPSTEAFAAVQPEVEGKHVAVPAFGAVVKVEAVDVLANKRMRNSYGLVHQLKVCELAYSNAFHASQKSVGYDSNLHEAYLAALEVRRGLEEYTADRSLRGPSCDSKPSPSPFAFAPAPAPAPAFALAHLTTAEPESAPFTTTVPAIVEENSEDEEVTQQMKVAASRGCASFTASTSGVSNANGSFPKEGKKGV